MKCPVCGGNDAYLYSEDGVTQPGKDIEVQIRCENCGGENFIGGTVAYAKIDVVLKRGSIELDEDYM